MIQTLLFALDGAPPPPEEIQAYCGRLRQILDGGGQIRLVQVHTIARNPAEASASPLADRDLDALADTIRRSVAPVPVETFYGAEPPRRLSAQPQ